MKSQMMFLDCPAFLDNSGALRCGLPAEVEYRYTVESTSGPLESMKIRCPRGHWFNGPAEFLSCDRRMQPAGRKSRAGAAAPGQAKGG